MPVVSAFSESTSFPPIRMTLPAGASSIFSTDVPATNVFVTVVISPGLTSIWIEPPTV